ncbi:MAG: hypothetical protein A2Y73_00045 [Chloroflexi bacterium RBG_13_56_8]|nr:MAG: hypothetical protein A2Y73_00045 [Chloroflexi bacterium RBG_13_56_8]
MAKLRSTTEQELEQAIERIRGVTSAKIILDQDGEIAEIHLMGSCSRPPKQIVRDTESLLHAHFGARVDYRRISLVQLDSDEDSDIRMRFRLVSAKPHPEKADQLQVILRGNGEPYEGTASLEQAETGGGDATICAASKATLSAIQKAIGPIVHLEVCEARSVPINNEVVSLVVLAASTPQGEQRLTGTCIINESVCEATAKATLDAINRRLPIWIARGSK